MFIKIVPKGERERVLFYIMLIFIGLAVLPEAASGIAFAIYYPASRIFTLVAQNYLTVMTYLGGTVYFALMAFLGWKLIQETFKLYKLLVRR